MTAPVESAATPTMVPLATCAGAWLMAMVRSKPVVNMRDKVSTVDLLAPGRDVAGNASLCRPGYQ